jgi:glucose/arabinose dehydrogenase
MTARDDLRPSLRRPFVSVTSFAMAFLLALPLVGCAATATAPEDLSTSIANVDLPEGFSIQPWATGLADARSMTRAPSGTIYVGTRRNGAVYAVRDTDGDGRADVTKTIAEGLDSPNGVAFRDGSLYVAEISRVLRYDGIDDRLDAPPEPVVVTDAYPTDRHHGWKYIAFGPDGWLYVPVGAPCNVCEEEDEIYSTITRVKPDGTGREIVARGVRNTVGFAWHPETGDLWFTDNGRDWMGNDSPPDELNRVTAAGQHFGFPYCHGGDIPDPEFAEKGDDKGCAAYVPPARKLGPHVAALGMLFYQGDMFPAEYRGQVFLAEHGSWNRETPIGYRVMLVRLDGQRATSYEPFASGWLPEGGDEDSVTGRPVDLLELPDGSLLVSDDQAGAIYRISYRSGSSDER